MSECNPTKAEEKLEFYRKINKEIVNDRVSFFKCFDLHKSETQKFNYKSIYEEWMMYMGELSRIERKDALSLYIHVPFCAAKCNFCCYDSVSFNKELVPKYLDYINEEVRLFAPITRQEKFDTIYFGGGTPNILNHKELEVLFKTIFENFQATDNPELKAECNPNFSDLEKLKIFREYRFNRLSFGVQSFDKDVLCKAKRPYQTDEKVLSAINDAEKLGFEDVNMDIMFGLEGDNTDKFLNSIKKAFQSNVGNIIIYKLMPTPLYYREFLLKESLGPDSPEKEVFSRIYDLKKVFFEMAKLADKYDYKYNKDELNYSGTNMGIGFKRADLARNFDFDKKNYSFYVDYPMSCLGLGSFSMSHIFGRAFYKNMNKEMFFDTEQNIYTGNRIELGAEILQDMANQIENTNLIDLGVLNNKYSMNLLKMYSKQLADLLELKLINIKDKKIYINEEMIKLTELLLFFTDIQHLRLLNRQKNIISKPPDYAKN